MADDQQEKTEEPTSKKIEDARKEGNVPRSMDTSGFIGLLIGIFGLLALGDYIFSGLKEQFYHFYTFFGQPLTNAKLFSLALTFIQNIVLLSLPIALVLVVAGVLGSLAQFGVNFTTKPLKPDLKKINPIKGAKNLFSMQKLVEGIKITLKVIVAFLVGSLVFWIYIKELQEVGRFDHIYQITWLSDKAMMIALIMLLVFFVFAVIDLAITRFQYFKKLRMSKQEIRDEYKHTEGNPEVKARIRRLQHEMANNRMMSDVPDATVVITNPTHFAVALKYDENATNKIPVVVAKGADLIAQKIKEIAREHNIQIVENRQLARELYKKVDVGDAIPEEFYQAVAEVLAYVYRINNSA